MCTKTSDIYVAYCCSSCCQQWRRCWHRCSKRPHITFLDSMEMLFCLFVNFQCLFQKGLPSLLFKSLSLNSWKEAIWWRRTCSLKLGGLVGNMYSEVCEDNRRRYGVRTLQRTYMMLIFNFIRRLYMISFWGGDLRGGGFWLSSYCCYSENRSQWKPASCFIHTIKNMYVRRM